VRISVNFLLSAAMQDSYPGEKPEGGRKPPWLQYNRVRPENSQQLRHAASSIDKAEMMWSEEQPVEGLRRQSTGLQQILLGPEKEEERRRAHMSAAWWLPEILSQIGGLLCLLGK